MGQAAANVFELSMAYSMIAVGNAKSSSYLLPKKAGPKPGFSVAPNFNFTDSRKSEAHGTRRM